MTKYQSLQNFSCDGENFNFALCPHVNENDVSKWESIAERISSVINKRVTLNLFSNNFDIPLADKCCHMYYANPELTLELLKRGYLPVAKLKDAQESLCSISLQNYEPNKKSVRVALVNQRYFLLPLLMHKREFKKFKLVFVKNYTEALELLRANKVDLAFIYTQFANTLKEDKSINFVEDYCFPLPHYILIHPSLEPYRDAIEGIDFFKPVKESDIDYLKSLYEMLDKLLADWAHHDIAEAVIGSPNFGVIVYQEKIVYANEYAREILGYSEEELFRKSVLEIIHAEDKEMIELLKDRYEKRLKGEKFIGTYELPWKKKDGTIVYTRCFTSTILFKGRYSGFILLTDITEQKFADKFKNILMEINKVITKSLTEEEIYEGVCRALTEKLGMVFVWISELDESKSKLRIKYKCGDDRGIFDVYDFKISSSDTVTYESLEKGKIIVNPNSIEYAKRVSCAEELVKRGFLSSCTIPFIKHGKVISLLKIYSAQPNFFNESVMEILEEIQNDISFALEKIEMIRENLILSESLKNSDTWILITDINGRITYVNDAVERISGYRRDELIGKNPRIFKSGLNPPEFYKEMWNTILSGKVFRAVTPNRKKDGEIFHVDLKIIPVKLPGGELKFVAVAEDISEKMKLSERVQELQNFDALTGLLNMNGFSANISQHLQETSRLGLLILIDIYDMTYINKILGISNGDRLLQEFAERLKKTFGDTEFVARIGADTFGIYLVTESSDDLYKAYSKIYGLNNAVFKINEKTISVNINAGITIFPKDGKNFKILYERADITLQQSKKMGPGHIQFFDPVIEDEAEKLWDVFYLVKKAKEENLFRFYYQPYYYADTLEIAGFEALVRIIDKEGKLYTPNVFIDYLENSQYLEFFEQWAISEVKEKIKKWNKRISLNISGRTFSNPLFSVVISEINSQLRDKLTIEITERLFIKNPEYAIQILLDIKRMDSPPQIAMDDFGTGYSSIVYLKDLPIDIIKIDRSFTKDMMSDKKSLVIVQTIINLAKRLKKIVLVEGVETEEQFDIVKNFGCDLVQGYLFSKPLPEEEIEKLLINN